MARIIFWIFSPRPPRWTRGAAASVEPGRGRGRAVDLGCGGAARWGWVAAAPVVLDRTRPVERGRSARGCGAVSR